MSLPSLCSTDCNKKVTESEKCFTVRIKSTLFLFCFVFVFVFCFVFCLLFVCFNYGGLKQKLKLLIKKKYLMFIGGPEAEIEVVV